MKKSLIQRARELPLGLWDAAQQFNVRHLVGDLVEAYKRVREENKQLRAERDKAAP